ncbi:hypothetical protein GETHLI_02540 [Geothrix limicola]|uniref:Uncharacterized protein n=1 Tax=Geothrix limicola TaxID=2927978 RepID=A0ABQ5QAA2_9BACT|nr:hypothetical protein [Geothrix limicola]GLH71752.1 hypothetical protein GETHLI_02540 [Geothrix limicola]
MNIPRPIQAALLALGTTFSGLAQTPPVVMAPTEKMFMKVDVKFRENARTFYRKALDIEGMPVLAGEAVADEALQRTYDIVTHVLAGRPDIIRAMSDFGTRLVIIGKDQVYTDLPDYRDTPDPAFWNERVRGTGGDDVTSFGEENLLNLANDRYDDMSVGLHEFAHTIDATLTRMDPRWQKELEALYRRAVAQGLFHHTYAGSNATEYWAELVTMYFDCERANNWNHGPVVTREELKRYQPEAYAFVHRTFRLSPTQDWRLRPLRRQPSVFPPPPAFGADATYTKFTYAREFPVLGTAKVSDAALLKANDTIRKLFAYRHDILKVLISQGARLVVLGRGERLSDLPEFKGRKDTLDFDEVRYLDYTPELKLLVVPEENVLNLPGDPFSGECMTLSVFAKAMYLAAGLRPMDPAFAKKGDNVQQYELRVQRMDTRFDRQVQAAFSRAAKKRIWAGTPAAQDRFTYWTAGVVAYFDGSGDGFAPVGAHRPITTHEALKAHDPELYKIVDTTMAYHEHVDWRFQPCPRHQE